jgi:hypothetical protein
MKILIHDNTTISEVQKRFNELFPYLKLEFFRKQYPHKPGALRFLPQNEKLGNIRKKHFNGELDVLPGMQVSQLESLFTDHFDLEVQVLRKSGSSWLETILTDSWTLQEQNKEGEFLSSRIRPEIPDPDQDID